MRAALYRSHAEEMIRCAKAALSEHERLEYLKLSKAWIALAEGADQGLTTDQPALEPQEA